MTSTLPDTSKGVVMLDAKARDYAHRQFWEHQKGNPLKVRIDLAIRAYLETVSPPEGVVKRITEVLMSHPLVDAPKDMADNFTALAEAVVAVLSPLPAPEPTEGIAEPVGWAYQDARWIDEGRWHLCMTEPKAIDGRTIQRVYLAASLTALQAERDEALRQRQLLAEAVADAAKRAGIYNGEVPLTGPHLLMFAEDIALQAERAEAELAAMKEGAAAIGYMREKDNDGTAFWVTKERNCYYGKSVFTHPAPADKGVVEALDTATIEACAKVCLIEAERVAETNADRYWQSKRIEGTIRALAASPPAEGDGR